LNPRDEEHRRESRSHREAPEEKPDRSTPEPSWRRNSVRTWVFLAVGLFLLALLLAGGLFLWRSLGDTLSGTSAASDSLDSGPEPSIRLSNGHGQISIEGVEDLEAIEYEATKHSVARDPASAQERAADIEVDISRDGSDFDIATSGGRNTGADYAVRVPPGASVEVSSEAGRVEVSGLSGSTSVVAEAGDVSVRDAGGSISVEAPAGDVEIENVTTETGQVNLEVGSGDVDLTDLVIGTLEAGIESGDASLSGRFSGGGRIFVQTGNINVAVPSEDARNLSLEARIGAVERDEAGEDGGSETEAPESETDNEADGGG
jgi:DUF4097 and DUF4098 domain-containing protein YvlB/nitrate reductase NapE component